MNTFGFKKTKKKPNIREIIISEVRESGAQRPKFQKDIQRLVSKGADEQTLVGALIKELWDDSHLAERVKELESQISELSGERDHLTTWEYQREINHLKEKHANEIQKFESIVSRYENDVYWLRHDKNVIEDDKRALEKEMRGSKHDDEVRRREMQRAHDLKLNVENIRLQEMFDAEKRALQSRLQTAHANEKRGLQAAHDAEEKHLLAKISEMRQEHELEKERERQEHESKREGLIASILEMQQNHESNTAQLCSRMSEMEREHDSEKDRIQKEHDSIMLRMSQEHDSMIGRMSQEHESNRARLLAEKAEMKQEHDAEQEQSKKNFDTRKLQLERQKIEGEARLKGDFETKKAQLETAHAAEKKRLQRDIEAYSGALLTRDDFKPMPDNEIKARFLDLAQEVDALARLEWRPTQKGWTNQVVLGLSGNQRLLRKQILQDSVWVILHKNIFCSPFRILGEEGGSLESQWNKEYGKGWSSGTFPLSLLKPALTSADSQLDNGSYIWPEPSIDAERWRYVSIKECRAALEKPASEWDPRARLKKGFKTSLDALKKELTSRLGEVSNLDKSGVQAAESIIIKAAKMWLEFGMQRCRILVVVQGSNLKSAEERIQRARGAPLELVVVPKLKRFGNSKGQDVQIEETVGDCDGEMVQMSMPQ